MIEREGGRLGEADSSKSCWDSQPLSLSGFSSEHQTRQDANENLNEDDSTCFTGVFQAKRVELVDPSAPFSTPPASPELDSPNQFDMDSLVDTLKNMGPALRTRSLSLRGQPQGLSALPPIVEDASSPATSVISDPLTNNAIKITAADAPVEARNHVYTMPADLGLKRTANRDSRSPLELMKQGQQVLYIHTLNIDIYCLYFQLRLD